MTIPPAGWVKYPAHLASETDAIANIFNVYLQQRVTLIGILPSLILAWRRIKWQNKNSFVSLGVYPMSTWCEGIETETELHFCPRLKWSIKHLNGTNNKWWPTSWKYPGADCLHFINTSAAKEEKEAYHHKFNTIIDSSTLVILGEKAIY